MADRPKNTGDVLKMMKDKDVKFLDLRFTDTKGRTVGVPTASLAFVEIEAADGAPHVGFAPAV